MTAALWVFSVALVLVGFLAWFLCSGRRVERSVGFFHPFTSDGGGGERVLWCAVREVQNAEPALETVVYTGDEFTGAELAKRASTRFGIHLRRPITVVRLTMREYTSPEKYPVFTMLGQAFGSAVCTAEALALYRPGIFFDTTGHAFGYPLARLAGCRVAAYVHYPTVSTDMIRRVKNRETSYNNVSSVVNSATRSFVKLCYYQAFAFVYGLCGYCADVAMVNSSWTRAHVKTLWGGHPVVVFPPCDVAALLKAPTRREATDERTESSSTKSTAKYVVSVGQFRREKDHALQLRAWAALKRASPSRVAFDSKGFVNGGVSTSDPVASARLKIVGGCRGESDAARLRSLRALAVELRIDDSVDFLVDVPYDALLGVLTNAAAGIHTMVDEHFGICVVEYMAAGAVPIAHRSAGPAMDIVVPAFDAEDDRDRGVAFRDDVGEEASQTSQKSQTVQTSQTSLTTSKRTSKTLETKSETLCDTPEDSKRPVGFLATTEREYASCMLRVLRMDEAARDAVAERARARATRFGEAQFAIGLRSCLVDLLMETDSRDRRGKSRKHAVGAEGIAGVPSLRKSL